MGPLSRPGSITGASILWIIYGSLGTLSGLVTLGMSGGRAGGPGFIGLGIAVAFLVSGIQGLLGKARGMLGSGIASIIWGLVTLVAFLYLASLVHGGGAGIFGILGLVFGGMLITSGALACIGNEKYKAWRASRGL
jgi:hypothetical protein